MRLFVWKSVGILRNHGVSGAIIAHAKNEDMARKAVITRLPVYISQEEIKEINAYLKDHEPLEMEGSFGVCIYGDPLNET